MKENYGYRKDTRVYRVRRMCRGVPNRRNPNRPEDILTTGEIPRLTDYEAIDSGFFIKEEETLKPDTFPDDLALICKSNKGLVIVLGCAHRGNTEPDQGW